MFDVDWSDPNRESVGDRRARKKKGKGKEHQKDSKDGAQNNGHNGNGEREHKKEEQDSTRASESIRSSVSSMEKQFAIFGGVHRKKGGSARKGHVKSVASSSMRSPTIEEQPQGETMSVPSSSQAPSLSIADDQGLPSRRFSSFADSVFSQLNENEQAPGGSLFGVDTTNPQPGIMSFFQELGDGVSMVTKTTEVTVRDRTEEDSDFLVSKITISAGDSDEHMYRASASKSGASPTEFNEVVHPLPVITQPFHSTYQSNQKDSSRLPAISESTTSSNGQGASNKAHKPKLSAPVIAPANQRPTTQAGTWKAPDDWGIYPSGTVTPEGVEDPNMAATSDAVQAMTLDLSGMDREILEMRDASPRMMLQRLKEDIYYDPRGAQDSGTADDSKHPAPAKEEDMAAWYKRREMARKRWLLSAVYNMETIMDTKEKLTEAPIKPKVRKTLALFESQATASYLAIQDASMSIYHLAQAPLSKEHFPNIHPIMCPTVSVAAIGFAANSFSAVHCLDVTAILPSSDVPKLLFNIRRVLAPGGLFHMILIDPWPAAASMGPRLQRWVDEHLVLNLELRFRGTRPSRSFPVWLENARLRGKGSAITTTRFQAVTRDAATTTTAAAAADNGASGGGGGSAVKDKDMDDMALKKELRSTVGRMLWRDIWGQFVTADRWWWEVPEIVDECIERDTYWEYSVIAACKSDD